jgi:hypothetical protein
MLKKIAVLTVLLLLALPGVSFAGASGGGATVFTTTTSTTTVDNGTLITNTTINGSVLDTKSWVGKNVTGTYTYSSVAYAGNASNFAEILSANYGTPGANLYWNFPWGIKNTNIFSGTLNQAQITAAGINPFNAGSTAVTISGRGTVVSQSSSLQSSTTFTIQLGSTTSGPVTTVTVVQIGDQLFQTTVNTNTNTTVNIGEGLTQVWQATGQVIISPIVLDLSHTGKIDASGGNWLPHRGLQGKRLTMFDFDGNGMDLLMEWVGPNAGLLVEPKADGTVDGTCLFGVTGGYESGYEKLSVRDKNNDRVLEGKELDGLYVWVDSNMNGKVDKGELHSLAELHITQLDLRERNYQSTFTMNGKQETMWDWWPNALNVRKIKVASK